MLDLFISILTSIPSVLSFYDLSFIVAVGVVFLALGFLGKLASPSAAL